MCAAAPVGMNYPLVSLSQVQAPVDTVIEGAYVAVCVFIESQSMEYSAESGFQVLSTVLIQRNSGSSLGWRPFTTTA